jgi:hypothetical protein
MDKNLLLVLLVIMGAVIAVLIWAVIILMWKLKQKEKQMVDDPFQMIRNLYSNDRNGNGIPDSVEWMLKRLERDMDYSDDSGFSRTSKSKWGRFESNINGKRIYKEWGYPDKDAERLMKSFEIFMDGGMSKEEFKTEMDRFGQMKSR